MPYDFNALEPVFSGKQLETHYTKHHATYVTMFNMKLDMMEKYMGKKDLKKVVSLADEMKFFGGGHYNHTFFWESMAPVKEGGGHLPEKGTDLH